MAHKLTSQSLELASTGTVAGVFHRHSGGVRKAGGKPALRAWSISVRGEDAAEGDGFGGGGEEAPLSRAVTVGVAPEAEGAVGGEGDHAFARGQESKPVGAGAEPLRGAGEFIGRLAEVRPAAPAPEGAIRFQGHQVVRTQGDGNPVGVRTAWEEFVADLRVGGVPMQVAPNPESPVGMNMRNQTVVLAAGQPGVLHGGGMGLPVGEVVEEAGFGQAGFGLEPDAPDAAVFSLRAEEAKVQEGLPVGIGADLAGGEGAQAGPTGGRIPDATAPAPQRAVRFQKHDLRGAAQSHDLLPVRAGAKLHEGKIVPGRGIGLFRNPQGAVGANPHRLAAGKALNT